MLHQSRNYQNVSFRLFLKVQIIPFVFPVLAFQNNPFYVQKLNVATHVEFRFQTRQQNKTLHHTRILCNQNQKSTVLVMYDWKANRNRSVSRSVPDKNLF